MCHENSDSNKSTDEWGDELHERRPSSREELRNTYNDVIDELRQSCLPPTRTKQITWLCAKIRQEHFDHGETFNTRIYELMTEVARCIEWLEVATVVSPEDSSEDSPESITPSDRTAVLGILARILFVAAETPRRE